MCVGWKESIKKVPIKPSNPRFVESSLLGVIHIWHFPAKMRRQPIDSQ